MRTPGPWTIADDLKTMDCIGIYGPNNTLVAEIRDPESVKPEEREREEQTMRDNAAVLAAAPAMLDALKLLQAVKGPVFFEDGWATLEDGTEICLNDLIAEAEGKE